MEFQSLPSVQSKIATVKSDDQILISPFDWPFFCRVGWSLNRVTGHCKTFQWKSNCNYFCMRKIKNQSQNRSRRLLSNLRCNFPMRKKCSEHRNHGFEAYRIKRYCWAHNGIFSFHFNGYMCIVHLLYTNRIAAFLSISHSSRFIELHRFVWMSALWLYYGRWFVL